MGRTRASWRDRGGQEARPGGERVTDRHQRYGAAPGGPRPVQVSSGLPGGPGARRAGVHPHPGGAEPSEPVPAGGCHTAPIPEAAGGRLTPGTTHHPMPMAAGTGPASAGTEAEPGAAAGPRPEARPEFRHVSVLGRLAFRHVSVRGGGPGRPRRRRRRPRADASPRRRAGGRTGGSTCAGGRSRAARSGGRTGRGGLRSRGSSPGLRSLAARAAPNHGVSQKGVTPSGSTLTTWAVPGMSVSRDADAPTPSAHCSNAH